MLFLNRGKKSSKLTKRRSLKMAIITTLAASTFAFSNIPASAASNFKLTTVYYVYLNETYIGTVSNKEVVDTIITEKAETLKETHKDVNLQIAPQVEYISEQVFHSTANNLEAVDNLEKAIQFQAEASAIVIDGKPVVYLDSRETAEEVVRNLKLKYVTAEQLTELEARKASTSNTLPALKENETRLLDVVLSENVAVQAEKIEPEKIVSVDEAITLLQKGTLEEKKYVVKEGDVLGSVANDNGLKLEELLVLNPDIKEDTVLKIGQEVNITALKPYIEVIVTKEMNQKEDIPFTKEVENDSTMPKGETKVKQEGKNGSRSVTFAISEKNGNIIKKEVASETVLQQPVDHIVVMGTKVIPSRGSGSLAWPTVGGYISSEMGYRWGSMHKGIDIARPSNRTIKAADNGVVVSAGYSGAYGNKIIIDHQNGLRTLYAHLSSIDVSVGQTVSKGSHIGVMGTTGNSTGIHLHFEVFKGGVNQNPLSYVGK
ncbi:M23 family metallopeptidase [Neobacillus sp. FSL H8-0543]|uniref:M23 family metallopeptidase n=1 Tax=Neobacillus sp. FSL H8-0543 TaxID=2954672 RepID=UPI0031594F0D